MRILFVNQTLGIGGAETFNTALLSWLHRHGNQVTAYTTNSRFARMLSQKNVTTHRIPVVIDIIGDWKGFIKGLFLMPVAVAYYTLVVLRNSKSDIIFMSGFIEKIFITPLASLLHIPVVWVEFASPTPVLTKFFGFPGLLYDLVKHYSPTIVVPSRHTLRQINNSAAHLIPLGIEPDPSPVPDTIPSLVCCVSRLEPKKGQDLLIHAWKQVVSKIPTAHLEIVGEGSESANLRKLISQLGLTNSITLTGWVVSSIKYIRACQVFVFPSIWPLEGFGITAVEAMSQGKPIVAFNLGPIPEIVDSKTGVLIPPGNTRKLAQALINLLNDPKLCVKLGAAGLQKYKQQYSLDVSGQKFLRLFQMLK